MLAVVSVKVKLLTLNHLFYWKKTCFVKSAVKKYLLSEMKEKILFFNVAIHSVKNSGRNTGYQ